MSTATTIACPAWCGIAPDVHDEDTTHVRTITEMQELAVELRGADYDGVSVSVYVRHARVVEVSTAEARSLAAALTRAADLAEFIPAARS